MGLCGLMEGVWSCVILPVGSFLMSDPDDFKRVAGRKDGLWSSRIESAKKDSGRREVLYIVQEVMIGMSCPLRPNINLESVRPCQRLYQMRRKEVRGTARTHLHIPKFQIKTRPSKVSRDLDGGLIKYTLPVQLRKDSCSSLRVCLEVGVNWRIMQITMIY